ncbi:MAG: hypothetical protein ACK5G7_03270 [Erysipelotrichaceae bacterium]
MKKLWFFVPAVIFTLLYGLLALGEISAINPIVIVWLLFLWLAGVLLSKTIFWGGLVGMIPALSLIYMGTQETGQIINEAPIGIVVLLYYLVCIYFVYKKRTSNSNL